MPQFGGGGGGFQLQQPHWEIAPLSVLSVLAVEAMGTATCYGNDPWCPHLCWEQSARFILAGRHQCHGHPTEPMNASTFDHTAQYLQWRAIGRGVPCCCVMEDIHVAAKRQRLHVPFQDFLDVAQPASG